MKLSTSSRYGLRALIDLAANGDGAPVSLGAIAERQQVSVGYLEHMFAILRKAGFVVSAKGSQGGYLPSAGLRAASVAEVLGVLEGDLGVNEPAPETDRQDRIRRCLDRHVWDVVNARVARIVTGVTVGGLADRMRGRAQNDDCEP